MFTSRAEYAFGDDVFKIDLTQANHQSVAEMIQKNLLGLLKIGIYSLKLNQNDLSMKFYQNYANLRLLCNEGVISYEQNDSRNDPE
jgi:hypothetical protein